MATTKPIKKVKFEIGGEVSDTVYEVVDDQARDAANAAVKTVNGVAPDATGNVEVKIENVGDMTTESYDPEGKVAAAGGITAYIESLFEDAEGGSY